MNMTERSFMGRSNMPKCHVNNVELYYEIKGCGEPIVFTHGASWNLKQWEKQSEYFSKNYQVILWDVRGHGKSTLPDGRVDSGDFSKDLIGLLDYLNINKANLCGLSMGGHISLQTAIRFPDRVNSLILIGTPFTNTYNWYEKVFVPINRLSNHFIPMSLLAKWQAHMLSKFNINNKKYIEEAVSSIPRRRWLRLWQAISKMESGDNLENVNCPTLILQGEYDTMTKRQQKHLHETIEGSKYIIIKDAHHATNLDNPTLVNQYIDRFLSEL